MKAVAALVLATAIGGCMSPLSSPMPHMPTKSDVEALDQAARRARTRRNLGVGLAVPGVAMTVVGLTAVVYGLGDPNLLGQGIEIGVGAVFAGFGVALGVPGVYFWSAGQDEMDVIKWRRRQLLTPFAAVRRDGATGGVSLSF
jgi:hypothetical protein